MNDFQKTINYIERTLDHIHRVHKNMAYLVTRWKAELFLSDNDVQSLMYQVVYHDTSKFSSSQYAPYIELTEFYRQRKVLGNTEYTYPNEEIKKQVQDAIESHYRLENHHIENANVEWTKHLALEIACDLQSMADEFGEGSARGYFENTWLPKAKEILRENDFCLLGFWITQAIRCFEAPIGSQNQAQKDLNL